jgi:crotonobetainyl-CoA:carnitine CoA-transferase CaiB-like acyl-CoA transferase
MGDPMAGVAAAGGVAAALFARERTGRGQRVSTSLMRIGAYMLGCDLSVNVRSGTPTVAWDRRTFTNPLINSYRDCDGKWFWLLCNQSERHWPDVVRAIGQPDLQDDERFATVTARREHAPELIKLLDETFAERPRAQWAEIFDRENVWWAPVQASHELIADPQARAGGVFVDVPTPDGSVQGVSTPVDFSGTPWAPTGSSAELGEHTEEVLHELGYTGVEIAGLVETGAVKCSPQR